MQEIHLAWSLSLLQVEILISLPRYPRYYTQKFESLNCLFAECHKHAKLLRKGLGLEEYWPRFSLKSINYSINCNSSNTDSSVIGLPHKDSGNTFHIVTMLSRLCHGRTETIIPSLLEQHGAILTGIHRIIDLSNAENCLLQEEVRLKVNGQVEDINAAVWPIILRPLLLFIGLSMAGLILRNRHRWKSRSTTTPRLRYQ